MKKKISRLLVVCVMLCCLTFGVSPVETFAADIKYNKKYTGTLKVGKTKIYYFEIENRQQIELLVKNSGKNQPELSVWLYQIKGMDDNKVTKWLDEHEDYWLNDDEDKAELYEKYEDDETDKLIAHEWHTLVGESDSLKIKKTLSKGNYYIEIRNEEVIDTVKFNLTLKKILSKPKTIKLNVKSVSLRYNKTKQLKATDKNGTDIDNKVITYSSSNKKVATVSKTGKITAKKAGTCKVIAKLKNGKKAVCTVTVPKLNMTEQLQQKPVYASVDCVNEKSIYNDCWVIITNNSGKKISYVELQIVQYNNKGDKLYRPYSSYYINETIAKKAKESFCFWVNDDTKKAKACIMKVYYSDGTTWTNPLYKEWANKYL